MNMAAQKFYSIKINYFIEKTMTSKFPSLPNPPDLSDVFLKFRHGAKPLLELHDIVLRGEFHSL